MLIASSTISYFLARRNLEPVQEALEAQTRFTADASHELRTPLTAMRTELEVALRNPALTRADMQGLLKSNLEEVIKLKNLSEGLLKLAQTDAKELHIAEVPLEGIMRDALRRLAPTAEAKHIVVENKTANAIVRGDEASLCELLIIIIDNAIKYSHAETAVTITSERQGRQVLIHVADHGRGIKTVDLPHIFERFYRADASRSKEAADGYGLGLPIAQKIIEANQGSIEVKSTYGKGSTFTIKLLAAA
jgi:two-component system OmpR family sensor kinase